MLGKEGPGGRQRLQLDWPEGYPGATDTQPGRPETHVITTGKQIPGGRQETVLEMDAKGRVKTLTDAVGGKTRYEYRNENDPDDCGCGSKPKRIVDPLGHEMVLRYDERQHIKSVTDSLGHSVRLTWTDDNLTSVETVDGTTVLGYDERSNLNLVRDPLGHEQRMTFNALGKLGSVKDNLGHETTLSYNASGFLTGRSLPPATPGAVRAQWTYTVDALGRRKTSRDPLGRVVRYNYDEADRIREVTLPAVTARARQEAQPEAKITYSYHPEGMLESVKAVDGKKTVYGYDDAFRLISVQEPGDQPPTRLRYDSLGNLLELVNPRQKSTLYTYDALNRLSKRVYPAPGGQETFAYDAASRLQHWQRTGGIGVDYSYDDADRLIGVSCAATGDNVLFGYDDFNRVNTMSDGSGTTTYDYLPNSLLKSVTRPGNRTLTYNYDLADRLESLADPEGLATKYTFNARNELTDVSLDGQTVHYEHDLLGRPTVTSYPNGMTLTDNFDERDRLLTRIYRKGGSPLLTLKYAYTQLGQRELSEQITGRGTDLRRYCYTNRRELESSERTVTDAGGPGSGHGKHGKPRAHTTRRVYKFDENQNRTKAGNTTAAHNDADQLTATSDGQSFSPNGAGQMTEAGQWSFTYNHAEQIKTAEKSGVNATYVYDGNGLRVQKRVSSTAGVESTDYLWAGAEVLKEYTGMGAAKATYLLGAGREGIKTDAGWQFYLRDALGSTVMTTDPAGEIASQFEYGDWGETTQVFGSPSQYNPYRYTGQQFDAEVGFYYLRARAYAPQLGRFLSRDPIGYSAGANLYSYCTGDPINYIDATGMSPTIDPRPLSWFEQLQVQQAMRLIQRSGIELASLPDYALPLEVGPVSDRALAETNSFTGQITLSNRLFDANALTAQFGVEGSWQSSEHGAFAQALALAESLVHERVHLAQDPVHDPTEEDPRSEIEQQNCREWLAYTKQLAFLYNLAGQSQPSSWEASLIRNQIRYYQEERRLYPPMSSGNSL